MVERLRLQGAVAIAGSPAEFEKFFRAEAAKWAPIVKASGARAD